MVLVGETEVRPSKMANDTAAVKSAETTIKIPGTAKVRRPAISSKRVPTFKGSELVAKFGMTNGAIFECLSLLVPYMQHSVADLQQKMRPMVHFIFQN